MKFNWSLSKTDRTLIQQILDRAERMRICNDRLTLEMDITAAHLNSNPIDLLKLLNAPPFDFGHDVLGIQKHIDRQTGRLTGYFVPRCSAVLNEPI